MRKKAVITILLLLILSGGLFYFLHPHNYRKGAVSASTCTEKGSVQYKCWCGAEYEETVAALGHDYKSEVTLDATCTEKGCITYICSLCSDSYTEEKEATGHNYVKEVSEKAGYTKEVCRECKEVVEQKDEAFWKNIITMYAIEKGDIYKEASTDSAVLGSLKKGDSVTVSKVGEWNELVMDDGTVGYVRGDLLSDTIPSDSESVDTTKETSNQTEQNVTANTGTTGLTPEQQAFLDSIGATTGGDPTGVTEVARVDRNAAENSGVDLSGVTLH